MLIEEKKAIKILGTFEFRQKNKNYNKIDLEDVGATNIVLNLITKLQKENEELKKYDYRNIKLDEKDRLKSPSMPKEKLDLMNNGIAIYKSFDKIFNDEENTDI